ncbi:LPS assembly lipoprotein LptE [Porphyromonas pogonae]|uniref:LPS assembly lipoprotein LptE n=1 Tax=Porphyromonas pogonae TaxID=867595 RepID=UPI002E75A8BB|nr:LPS assembly lipoprotein LptE [Porphyromonas pogonae]
MGWTSKYGVFALRLVTVVLLSTVLAGCKVSYKFNGGTIDYTQIKTITITDVKNQAPMVYPSFAPKFTEGLKDIYTKRTKLEQVPNNGDLLLDVTIVGYDTKPVAIQENAYAAKTAFTVTVSVTFENAADEKQNFTDRTFTAFREFDSSVIFTSVQDALLEEITEDLIKQIYNVTVENW